MQVMRETGEIQLEIHKFFNSARKRKRETMPRAFQGNSFFVTSPNVNLWETPQELEGICVDPNIRYLAIGRHTGRKTGYEHVHISIEFTRKKAWTVVKELFGEDCHVERRMGNRKKGEDYLGKDGKLRIVCNRKPDNSGQGHRSDIDEFDELVKAGASWNDLVVACPKLTTYNRRGARERFKDLRYERNRVFTVDGQNEVKVYLYLGPSGAGKTSCAMLRPEFSEPVDGEPGQYRMLDTAAKLEKEEGRMWWDNVTMDTECVLCDEFNGSWMSFGGFCARVKSNGAVRFEVKGDFEYTRIRTWIFTSIQHPKFWYKNTTEYEADRNQLKRRLDHIYWVERGENGELQQPVELDKERFMKLSMEDYEGWMSYGRKKWCERYDMDDCTL